MEMKMKIEGQVLGLKANNNCYSRDIHHVCDRNAVPDSIIGYLEVIGV